MFAICSDGLQYLGGDIKQQSVKLGLVLVRQIGNGRWQRENHVVILHGQQISLTGIEPALGCGALALGAVAIAAGVVGDLFGGTAFAAQDISSQRRRAALLDGRHDLELSQTQVAALLVALWRPCHPYPAPPLRAMSMRMSASAGSARACRRERLCMACAMPGNRRLISDVLGSIYTQRHTGSACIRAVIVKPLPESP